MDIDASQGRSFQDLRGQDLTEGGDHHQIGIESPEQLEKRLVPDPLRLEDQKLVGRGQFLCRRRLQAPSSPSGFVRLGYDPHDGIRGLDEAPQGRNGEFRGSHEQQARFGHDERTSLFVSVASPAVFIENRCKGKVKSSGAVT